MKTQSKHQNIRRHHSDKYTSIDTLLFRLHIHVLSRGEIPKRNQIALEKSNSNAIIDDDEKSLAALTKQYIEVFGEPKLSKNGSPIKWIPTYSAKILLALCEFIDNPVTCHQGRLKPLYYCQSIIKPLQFRQRVTLLKVCTTLFMKMNITTGRLGRYGDERTEPVKTADGMELFQPITHGDLRYEFAIMWREKISKKRYFAALNHLKLAGFFEVESCFLANEHAEMLIHEKRMNGASVEEIEELAKKHPRVVSVAAYKEFTKKFFSVFKELLSKGYMRDFLSKQIDKLAKQKRSGAFMAYSPYSDGFFTRKRKEYLTRFLEPKYSQTTHSPNSVEASFAHYIPVDIPIH